MFVYVFLTIAVLLLSLRVLPEAGRTGYQSSGQAGYQGVRQAGYRGSRQQMWNRACLGMTGTLLFLVSAFRLGIGNDYGKYIENFHEVYVDGYVVTEHGYNAVVKTVYTLLGGEFYIPVFAVFAFITVVVFLYGIYSQSELYFLSMFLFMTLGLYFNSLNTVRYYIALAFALWSMKYVIEKRWIKFIVVILLASLFHKSVLIVIPVYILATLPWKKWQLAIISLVFVSMPLAKDFYLTLLLKLYPSYQDTEFLEAGTSVTNILRCILVLGFALLFYKEAIKNNKRNQFYFYLNLAALGIYTCCYFIPVISRTGYYLNISQILFVPGILQCIKDEKKKKRAWIVILIMGTIYFMAFLYKAKNPAIDLVPYRTWLFG